MHVIRSLGYDGFGYEIEDLALAGLSYATPQHIKDSASSAWNEFVNEHAVPLLVLGTSTAATIGVIVGLNGGAGKKFVSGISGVFTPLIEGYDFGKHLRSLIGDPPIGMMNPHAHHILFKKGLGPAQKALVEEGQAILRKVGIDPIYGKENLVWAPYKISQQHGPEALKNVVDKLRELDRVGADYEEFVEALKRLGKEAAKRGT